MAPFKPVFQPSKIMPKALSSQSTRSVTIRDQLPLTTWLLVGASLHGLFSIILPHSAIYLSGVLFAILAFKFGTALLQVYGVIPNPEMARVVPGKVSAQLPDANGNIPDVPSKESVVVMFLGFKSNHPLKIFGPGVKEAGDFLHNMIAHLDTPENREKYGVLGISSYIGNQTASSNELLTISYWRNIEGIHEFADSPFHREAWVWWERTAKQHPYLSISHEIYKAEGTQHENIYLNFSPTLIGGTAVPVKAKDDEEGATQWMNPLVDAKRGILAASKGRLRR